jgi:hypothetical protein
MGLRLNDVDRRGLHARMHPLAERVEGNLAADGMDAVAVAQALGPTVRTVPGSLHHFPDAPPDSQVSGCGSDHGHSSPALD